MPTNSPIIIIDDDDDDRFFIEQAIGECQLTNPVLFFDNGASGLVYLQQMREDPFIILCDINMPITSGLELRRQIEADPLLREKSIPFIFLTTSDSTRDIREAYKLSIHGYFKKPNHQDGFKKMIQQIVSYWQDCLHPGNY